MPYEEVEIVNVDELRRIVYKVFPETNTMDMYIKLLNDNEALAAEIAALREEVTVLKEAPRPPAPRPPKGGEDEHPLQGDGGLEESTPVTMGEVNEYYSDRAKEAVKRLKPKLMSDLSLIIPDPQDLSRFIDSIPAPNNMDELWNSLFEPYCEDGRMNAEAAWKLVWSDYILELTDFDRPLKQRQFNDQLNKRFDAYLLKKKQKK